MNRLECAPLTLEPQTAAHADEMFAVLSDPAIYEYENEPPESVEWLRARFERLESRRSGDGSEHWLNWVIRLPSSELIGYVQASVSSEGTAVIAYVLNSQHWGCGFGRLAVRTMIAELMESYGVHRLVAILKRRNGRSMRLLERLGFTQATPEGEDAFSIEADESMMTLDPGSIGPKA